NEGVGARAEGGTLPTAQSQGWAEERVPLFYNYAAGRISGPLMKSAETSKASFIRAIDAETKMIVNDLKRDVNRQLWGDGTGAIGTSPKEITGAQLIVDSTGTVFNVNPSTYPVWVSVENGNSGTNRSISETLMAQVVHDTQIAGGEWPNLVVCSHGVQRAYAA